jgi:hypothetical protein
MLPAYWRERIGCFRDDVLGLLWLDFIHCNAIQRPLIIDPVFTEV